MNKTFGTTLLVAGTMIGAGMLAMPLTSAGIGFGFTLLLLLSLWALLTFSALLFVEIYQTAEPDAGIGSLAAQYFGKAGRIVATLVLIIFLYALLSAYVSGGGKLLADLMPQLANQELTETLTVVIFTLVFGLAVVISTKTTDNLNRLLFLAMIVSFIVVLVLLLPKMSVANLLAQPTNSALIISASPVFFTAFGFHGSIPSLNQYLNGNSKALRFAIICGGLITLSAYILWQLSTHGVLSQSEFSAILSSDPSLNGLINATLQITGSATIARAVLLFSALALITSFLGVSLGLLATIDDLFKRVFKLNAGRLLLGLCTFLPPMLFALFYPAGFTLALGYAGQMFAFYAIVLPIALVWRVRKLHPNLPYRVMGGKPLLLLVLLLGVGITCIPFAIKAGYLPFVVG